jgi:hypothetical protein
VASGAFDVKQNPAVNPYVGQKTGSFTITVGRGRWSKWASHGNVSSDGTIRAVFSVPTSTGIVPVAISGVVDSNTGQVTITGTANTPAGTLILSAIGPFSAGNHWNRHFHLSRSQGGSAATTVSSGTFRGSHFSHAYRDGTQPGGGGSNQLTGNYSGSVTVTSESPSKTGS